MIKYIEYNPVEANITSEISSYPHTFSYKIFKSKKYYPCSNNSILLQEFDIKTPSEFVNKTLSKEEIKMITANQKVKKEKENLEISKQTELKEYFKNINSKENRNQSIINAHNDGYTQIEISFFLDLSKSMISKVIKSGDLTPGV